MTDFLLPPHRPPAPDEQTRRAMADDYEEFNRPYRTDPFKTVHHATVRRWYETGCEVTHHRPGGRFSWGAVVRTVKTERRLIDFTGGGCGVARPGDRECVHFAYADAAGMSALVGHLNGRVSWLTGVNQENPRARPVLAAVGARFASARISGVGAGDVCGIYSVGGRSVTPPGDAQRACFGRFGGFRVGDLADRLLAADLPFAVSERGSRYGGPKKTWRRVFVRMAGDPRGGRDSLVDHPVFRAVPRLLDVIETVAPARDMGYTMLTRTDPEEGVVARHSDIALDAKDTRLGPEPGRVMRFHFVLKSNPDCVFRIWNLDGQPRDVTMRAGEIWYADVRKPHEVHNRGLEYRLHLMADFFADTRPWEKFTEVVE